MLFPDPKGALGRPWYLVPHDKLFTWMKRRHGNAQGWNNAWSYPRLSKPLSGFLAPFLIGFRSN
jgi:hypothetical protein